MLVANAIISHGRAQIGLRLPVRPSPFRPGRKAAGRKTPNSRHLDERSGRSIADAELSWQHGEMMVKIVRRPTGEAPEWVRDAWIGMSLPLAREEERSWIGLGVLSGPYNPFAQIWARIRSKAFKISGYAVNAKAAVDSLADHQPNAAAWWRKNTPLLLDGKRNFVFDTSACERPASID